MDVAETGGERHGSYGLVNFYESMQSTKNWRFVNLTNSKINVNMSTVKEMGGGGSEPCSSSGQDISFSARRSRVRVPYKVLGIG